MALKSRMSCFKKVGYWFGEFRVEVEPRSRDSCVRLVEWLRDGRGLGLICLINRQKIYRIKQQWWRDHLKGRDMKIKQSWCSVALSWATLSRWFICTAPHGPIWHTVWKHACLIQAATTLAGKWCRSFGMQGGRASRGFPRAQIQFCYMLQQQEKPSWRRSHCIWNEASRPIVVLAAYFTNDWRWYCYLGMYPLWREVSNLDVISGKERW